MDNLFIAIAGNISAGKSTLTKILAEKFQAKPIFEPVSENPYLADFYKDMKHWAYHSQMFFLGQRLKDQVSLSKQTGIFIQDRTIYEDAEIFAKNLFERGFIEKRDWDVYQGFYQAILDLLPSPDLIIYLKNSVPTIKKRIKMRGREFEQKIDEKYLLDLNRLYDDWAIGFKKSPILTIPLDDLNYLEDPKKLDYVIDLITKELGGRPASLDLK
ncbi:MAG: deoxynucleoside kinase [Minisyncoccota bacterium]